MGFFIFIFQFLTNFLSFCCNLSCISSFLFNMFLDCVTDFRNSVLWISDLLNLLLLFLNLLLLFLNLLLLLFASIYNLLSPAVQYFYEAECSFDLRRDWFGVFDYDKSNYRFCAFYGDCADWSYFWADNVNWCYLWDNNVNCSWECLWKNDFVLLGVGVWVFWNYGLLFYVESLKNINYDCCGCYIHYDCNFFLGVYYKDEALWSII